MSRHTPVVGGYRRPSSAGLVEGLAAEVEPRWQDRAACANQGAHADTFFRTSYDDEQRAEVADDCDVCPVAGSCLAVGLINNEQGVWGGTTYDERKELRDKLRKGIKPAKVLVSAIEATRWARGHSPEPVSAGCPSQPYPPSESNPVRENGDQ